MTPLWPSIAAIVVHGLVVTLAAYGVIAVVVTGQLSAGLGLEMILLALVINASFRLGAIRGRIEHP